MQLLQVHAVAAAHVENTLIARRVQLCNLENPCRDVEVRLLVLPQLLTGAQVRVSCVLTRRVQRHPTIVVDHGGTRFGLNPASGDSAQIE